MYVLAIREVLPRFRSVEGPQKDTVRSGVAKQPRTLSFKIKTNDKEKGGNVGLPNCFMYFD